MHCRRHPQPPEWRRRQHSQSRLTWRLETLPAAPQTLALYLKALETRRSRSPAGLRAGDTGLALPKLRRRLAVIASRHATAGLDSPTNHPLVRKLLRRYSRTRGIAVKKKEPLLIERLPGDPHGDG